MHSASFTAFSWLETLFVAPLAVRVSEGAFEPQPAPIRATMARAAHGRGFLLTAASLDRGWGRRTWQGNRRRRLRGAVRSARVRCRRSGTARTERRVRTAT